MVLKFLLFSIVGAYFWGVSYGRLPLTYNEYYARHKLIVLGGIIGFNETAYRDYLNNCFFNHTFYVYKEVICDMFATQNHSNPNITCAGSVIVSHDDEAVILIFRYSVQDDGDEVLNYYNMTTPFPGGGTVIKFYYNAFNVLWASGLRDAFFSAKNTYSNYELWVTGVSLGAGLSSIAAPYISQMGYFDKNNIRLVNFAAMRVGLPDFVSRIADLVPYAYRVTHRNDIVPHLYSEIGMVNFAKEIWYNNNMTIGDPYIECDAIENTTCSNSVNSSLWTWKDHGSYFPDQWCIKFTTPPTNTPYAN